MFALSKQTSPDNRQLDTTLEGSLTCYFERCAQRALAQRATPLIAEMELYFPACFAARALLRAR